MKRSPRNVKLYLVSTIFRAASTGAWSLLLNLYLDSLGLSVAFIGLTNTLFTAFSVVCSIPAGLIADRIGRKRAMVIGLTGIALSRLGVAVFSKGWLIAASSTLFGIVGPLFFTSVPPFLTENSRPRDRAMLFTVDASLMNLASFVATTGGGYLPRLLGAILGVGPESAPAYRGAMLAAAGGMAAGLVPVLALHGRQSPAFPRRAARLLPRTWPRFSDPRLMARILIPRLLNGFGAGLVFPFLNLFYKQQFGVSDAALGWILGVTSVTVALMQLVGGAIAERQGKIRATLVARAVATPMMLIMGFVPSLPLVAAANWVRSGLMRLGGPLYMAFVMEQLDESERATGSSLMAMTWDLGWSTAPYVSGLVQVQWGFGPLFVATTALYGLSVVCVYRFFGRRARIKPRLQRIGK